MLFAAPHRAMFAAGMAQGLLAMGLWAFDLAGRHWGLGPSVSWPLPPAWVHALMLIDGVFAFFVFGFILTAGPRWQRQPDTAPSVFRPVQLLMIGGWLVADAGWFIPSLLPAGLLVTLIGWSLATLFLWRLFARSPDDRLHVGAVAAAHSAGALGLAVFAWLTAGGPVWLGPVAVALGLWAYLLPMFLTVLHRMLPFFSQSVIPNFRPQRPLWALVVLLAGSVGHGLTDHVGLASFTWLFDLPAAVVALRLTLLWRIAESFAATILAVLHLAFAWVGIGFGLLGLGSLLLLAGLPGLGLAPLHALTIGFMSSALVGMASRVTLGHSGRPLVGDRAMWICFWGMQVSAVLRIGSEFWTLAQPAAALVWLSTLAVWAHRYAPAYWRPREDGQPG